MYYKVNLKEWRLCQIEMAAEASPVRHIFVKETIADKALVDQLYADYHFDVGLPNPPYAVYNIGGDQPENVLDYISILQEELVRAGVLPVDYDCEGHRELIGMQAGDVLVTYANSAALENDYGFTPRIGIR